MIDRFNEDGNPARARLRPELEASINRLKSAPAVGLDTPEHTRDVVLRALADADELIHTNGATSAVDRIHTALHGHVLALCEAAGIEADRETTMNRALKLLRQSHPALAASGPRADDITRVLGAMRRCSIPSTRSGTTRASRTRTRSCSTNPRRTWRSTPHARCSHSSTRSSALRDEHLHRPGCDCRLEPLPARRMPTPPPLPLPDAVIEVRRRHAHLRGRGGQDPRSEPGRDGATGHPQRVGDEAADHPVRLDSRDPGEHLHVVPRDPGALTGRGSPRRLHAHARDGPGRLPQSWRAVSIPSAVRASAASWIAAALRGAPACVEVRFQLPIRCAQLSGPLSSSNVVRSSGTPSVFGSPPCSRR